MALKLSSGYLVAAVTEHKPADMAAFAKEKDAFARSQAQEVAARIANDAVARRRKELEDRKAVFINSEMVKRLDPSSYRDQQE